MEQLLKADRELFLVMAHDLQHSGERLSETPSPMNQAMPRLMTDPRITMHLLPLPTHAARASSSTTTPAPPRRRTQQPRKEGEKCEEMENSLIRQKLCARQNSRITSNKTIKEGHLLGLQSQRRLQRASDRRTVQERGAYLH